MHASLLDRAIDIVNQNFLFLTLFGLLPLGYWLRANTVHILKAVIVMSAIVNIIAILQVSLPGLSFHDTIFSLYGGQTGSYGLTSGEFLCRIAHRCTSLFATVQALALFNLLVIALLLYLLRAKNISTNTFWAVAILALFGGLASVSKTFLVGLPIIVIFMLGGRRLFVFGVITSALVIPILMILNFDYQSLFGRNMGLIDGFSEYGIEYIFASRFGGANYDVGAYETLYNSMKDIPYIFLTGIGSDYEYYGAVYTDHMYLQLIMYGGLPYAILFTAQYLLFFSDLASRVVGPGRHMIIAIASTHFAIGLAYAVFFTGRYVMLMVVVLLAVIFDFNNQRWTSRGPPSVCRAQTESPV